MMREIKFRAWGPNSKYMWSWDELVANDTPMSWMQPSFGEKILAQYTGLKDKTGKEIYEGDILQCKCGMWRLDGKQTDKISIKNYEVKWEQITGRWNLYKNGKFELLQPFNKEHLVTWYTVIGNIHENPELLGDV